MSKDHSSESFFHLSPASRAALILVSITLAGIGISSFWVYREAMRIKSAKERSFRENRAFVGGEMIWIPAGGFTMGGTGPNVPEDELPLHDVKIAGFWVDKYEVTNEHFARFTKETGYVTTAERPLTAQTTPGLPPELEGKAASLCFQPPKPDMPPSADHQWWRLIAGADWRHPEGPDSTIAGRERHPVVHVSYQDALAYSAWAGKRLPTEAEWEYAARGGLIQQPFVWGSEIRPQGRWVANFWQGRFPLEQRVEDGFAGTAPAGSFPGNLYGLSDMAGNVWEITSDWYRSDAYQQIAKASGWDARRNPQGPADSLDPDEPSVWKKVARGGSFLSAENSSRGIHVSGRMKIATSMGRQDLGFRCVKDGSRN